MIIYVSANTRTEDILKLRRKGYVILFEILDIVK